MAVTHSIGAIDAVVVAQGGAGTLTGIFWCDTIQK